MERLSQRRELLGSPSLRLPLSAGRSISLWGHIHPLSSEPLDLLSFHTRHASSTLAISSVPLVRPAAHAILSLALSTHTAEHPCEARGPRKVSFHRLQPSRRPSIGGELTPHPSGGQPALFDGRVNPTDAACTRVFLLAAASAFAWMYRDHRRRVYLNKPYLSAWIAR